MKKRINASVARRERLTRAPLFVLAFWAPLCTAGEATEATEATETTTPGEPSVVSRPSPEGVPSLQMSTDFAQPGLGFGTYAPIGQVQSRGVRVAPFTIRAGVQTGVGFDDNVGLSETNKTSSLFFTVAPSVAVGLEGATQRYYAIYRGNYGRYGSSSRDNYEDHDIGLSAANSWTTRLRSLLSYNFLRGHTPRGITSSSTGRPELWTLQTLRASGSYGAAGAQGRLGAELGYGSRRFSGQSATAVTGDYDQFSVGGTFSYRLAPKTRATVQATWSDITHPREPTLSNVEVRYQLGVTWEALAKTTGRFGLGYTTKDFSSPSRGDFTGQNYDAGVTWTPLPYSSVDLSARRFLTESFAAGSNLVVNNVAGIAWNHLWSGGIRSTVNYAYVRTLQEGLNRTDTYQNLAARVSYGIRPSVRVGAELRHDTRDSTAPGLDYTRNIMLVTLEGAL